MKRLLLALVGVMSIATQANAQTTPWAHKLFYNVTSHDFGVCPRGAKLKHRFRIRNIYAVPMEITNIRGSCRCLSYQANSMRLEPKGEGYIDIVMDAATFNGPKAVVLYVTFGPKYISTAQIRITATARQDVVFNPGEVNFGIVQAGSTPTGTVEVEYAGTLNWRIVEVVKSPTAPFQVKVHEKERDPGRVFRAGKVSYIMSVTLNADANPGTFREQLVLKTNDPASPVLTVCVEGTVQAALTVLPNVVDLHTLRVGQTKRQNVIIRGSQAFRITAVEGTGNGVEASVANQNAKAHVLQITCRPGQPGVLQRQLRIRTNHNGGAMVGVRVNANVTK